MCTFQVMELLPNDISLIIYRHIHVHNMKSVHREYRRSIEYVIRIINYYYSEASMPVPYYKKYAHCWGCGHWLFKTETLAQELQRRRKRDDADAQPSHKRIKRTNCDLCYLYK